MDDATAGKKNAFSPSSNFAFRLKKVQVENLKRIFGLFDEKADGYMKRSDLGNALRTANCLVSEVEIADLLEEVDPDNKGRLDLGSFFIVAARKLRDNTPNKKITEAVRKLCMQTSFTGGDSNSSLIPVSVLSSIAQVRGGEPVDEEIMNKFLRYLPTNDTQQAEFTKVIELLLSDS